MSVDQLQRRLNRLDKEITELNRKKADEDKKIAYFENKASKVSISSNASSSTIKSKLRERQRNIDNANKARDKSSEFSKRISRKRKERNDVYLKLQKSISNENKKKEKNISSKIISYERRINELESFNSKKFVINNFKDEEYDVFISHATEDKEDFVNEFVIELTNLGIKV